MAYLVNAILCYNENEQTTAVHNNINRSHKHSIENNPDKIALRIIQTQSISCIFPVHRILHQAKIMYSHF